jgi:N-acetylmuramoyl-L-alanine amidase
MSQWHTVQRGEVLSHIAADAGFFDPDTIWNAPENADLRKLRPDPNVLVEGDRVFIPDKVPKEMSAASGQLHAFELGTGQLVLRLRVLDSGGAPVAKALCKFNVADSSPLNITDNDGRVERPITIAAGAPRPIDGGIDFNPKLQLVFHLKIGDLDHEDTPKGQQARLNNLGYFAGSDPPPPGDLKDEKMAPEDKELLQQFQWAVEEFQCDCKADKAFADLKIQVNGKMDKSTQQALVRAHGS